MIRKIACVSNRFPCLGVPAWESQLGTPCLGLPACKARGEAQPGCHYRAPKLRPDFAAVVSFSPRFASLRLRLLLLLWFASSGVAGVVTVLSYAMGRQWAMSDVRQQFAAMHKVIQPASFPLTDAVLSSLAELGGVELIALNERGEPTASTLAAAQLAGGLLAALPPANSDRSGDEPQTVRWGNLAYVAFEIRRGQEPPPAARGGRVIVLFEQAQIDAASLRAGLPPLATGLLTIALLSTLVMWITGRVAGRVARLQRGVERIANGDFNSPITDLADDELGRLGQSVDKMASQLKTLWQQLHQQQRQKLLHQIAGGMAHQLRNTLTGARLALELHGQSSPHCDQAEVAVALREINSAESYVRRLLLIGAGEQHANEPSRVLTCLHDVRSSHAAVAKHLHVALSWELDDELQRWHVADGATFSAAISNLVLNALQAAQRVQVVAECVAPHTCCVTVSDDGPGIAAAIADQLFEPFVSTKPEGLGLGLPVVQRAAEKLAGHVHWTRRNGLTVFEFSCEIAACPKPS